MLLLLNHPSWVLTLNATVNMDIALLLDTVAPLDTALLLAMAATHLDTATHLAMAHIWLGYSPAGYGSYGKNYSPSYGSRYGSYDQGYGQSSEIWVWKLWSRCEVEWISDMKERNIPILLTIEVLFILSVQCYVKQTY